MSTNPAPVPRLSSPLPPGSVIGILGGGQLGRMLAQAAAQLGLHAHIYCPAPQPPAAEVAKFLTPAEFDNEVALAEFADHCDVVTFEFENIPLKAADLIALKKPLYPPRPALEFSQDRQAEKTFLQKNAIAVAEWREVGGPGDLEKTLTRWGGPALLKTRRLGYDGRGQIRVEAGTDPAAALEAIDNQPAIVERMVDFECEISVILARGADGREQAYDIPRNRHENGILQRSSVPCKLEAEIEAKAVAIAGKIARALDYRGVLAVEFFVVGPARERRLLVNEFAPRVHNSGHWTLDACLCSQFENHIRAVAGWPLGTTERHANARMDNLLGRDVLDWEKLAARPNLALHLYGKRGTRKGRKLGHITQISTKTD